MNGSVDKFAYARQARKLGSVQYDIDISAIEWNYNIAWTIIIEYMLASKYFHFHKVADLSCSRMGGTCRYNWTSCSRRDKAERIQWGSLSRQWCISCSTLTTTSLWTNRIGTDNWIHWDFFKILIVIECLLLVNSDIYLLWTSVFIIDNTYWHFLCSFCHKQL